MISGPSIRRSELAGYARRKAYRIRVFNGSVQGDGFLRLEGENYKFYPDHLHGESVILTHGQVIEIQHDGTIGEFAPRRVDIYPRDQPESEAGATEQEAQQAVFEAEAPGTADALRVEEVGTVNLSYDDLGKVNNKTGQFEGVEGRFAYTKATGLSFIPTDLRREPFRNVAPDDEFTVFDAPEISISYFGVAYDKITCICPGKPEPVLK